MIVGEKIKLRELLSDIVDVDDALADSFITGVTIDSRLIKRGDLFLAYSGAVTDGRNFIVEAVDQGALAVLCEERLPEKMVLPQEIPVIAVPDLRFKASLIAARFYGYPARKLKIIGVTGTNGKTSTTQYIATALTNLGIACGVIGTIGVGFPGKLAPVINTTPDPVSLQRLLFELSAGGAKAVAMEVSSQGLVQGRVNGIEFEIAVFTNLTRDHLDHHGTIENYGNAKRILFRQQQLKYAVINADDEFGQNLIQELKNSTTVYAYTLSDRSPAEVLAIKAQEIKLTLTSMVANVTTPWGDGLLNSQLLGKFNLSNLLVVLTVLGIMKINLEEALNAITKLRSVTGRMEIFGGGPKKPLVVVDYAHTPDALEQVLLTLRDYCKGALWCIFGCGGDRDHGKRLLMGQIAERCSDHVVITNDNPRMETPKKIIEDILQGFLCPWAVEVEDDRMIAIEYVINSAKAGDLVLIAGKGHENYQIIGKEKLPFSDQEIVIKALNAKVV